MNQITNLTLERERVHTLFTNESLVNQPCRRWARWRWVSVANGYENLVGWVGFGLVSVGVVGARLVSRRRRRRSFLWKDKNKTTYTNGFIWRKKKKLKKKSGWNLGFSLDPNLHWRVNSTDGQRASSSNFLRKRLRSDGGWGLRSEMEGEGLRDGGLRSDGGEGSDRMERRSAMGWDQMERLKDGGFRSDGG